MMSRSAEYALRAVLHLAQQAEPVPVRATELAEALQIPRNYLQKVLHTLAKQGVLHSLRGPSGGFSLALPPTSLAIQAVVEPFDPSPEQRRCLLGRPGCGDEDPCSAHSRWSEVADRVGSFFQKTTIADLVAEARPRVPLETVEEKS